MAYIESKVLPITNEPMEINGEVVGVLSASIETREMRVLIQHEDDPSLSNYECGAETQSGTCSRSVDSPEETCWDH